MQSSTQPRYNSLIKLREKNQFMDQSCTQRLQSERPWLMMWCVSLRVTLRTEGGHAGGKPKEGEKRMGKEVVSCSILYVQRPKIKLEDTGGVKLYGLYRLDKRENDLWCLRGDAYTPVMATFPGLRLLLLVLAGLALCMISTAVDPTKQPTPLDSTTKGPSTLTIPSQTPTSSNTDKKKGSSTSTTQSPKPASSPTEQKDTHSSDSAVTVSENTTSPSLSSSTSNKTGTNSSDSAVTVSKTTALPSLTSSTSNKSDTVSKTTASPSLSSSTSSKTATGKGKTTILTPTSKLQHSSTPLTIAQQTTVSFSHSTTFQTTGTGTNSTNTVSMNTASSSLTLPTSTTTGTYKVIEREKNSSIAFEVKITSNSSRTNYTVEYTDTLQNHTETMWSGNELSLLIPFKMLKPSRKYTVHVPNCTSTGNTWFQGELTEKDIKVNLTGTDQKKVCFETEWNLPEKCFDVTKANACTNQTIFKEVNYTGVNITLPPAEKLYITFEKWIPTKFTWVNKPENCENISIACSSTVDKTVKVKPGQKQDLKPSHNYSCTGTYHYEPCVGCKTVNISTHLLVNIECDMRNAIVLKPSNKSILATWNVNQTCHTPNFTAKVTCNPKKSEGDCNLSPTKSCNVKSLDYFTDYTCQCNDTDGYNFCKNNNKAKTLPGREYSTCLLNILMIQ
ncbi:flocculation protein FLO11-like [Astyanax mexicanus]|uniref:Flocculation protein FLO11-like n=1 Tax=Astyanax mexicanus TaxID=7994 RepID=A0A8T2LCY9_ASTMX|nr:flocculation protein FLO11-like [Astyanax mexicanus]